MTSGAARRSSGGPIILEGELTIYTAAETMGRLRSELERLDACRLDLSRVTEVDGAGLQLLLWVKAVSDARGMSLSVVAHSEAVGDVLKLLHLEQRFPSESAALAGGELE